jgi:hypothetical protein
LKAEKMSAFSGGLLQLVTVDSQPLLCLVLMVFPFFMALTRVDTSLPGAYSLDSLTQNVLTEKYVAH